MMSEAGRRPGQKRDGAEQRVPPPADEIKSVPWAARTDDRRAYLVNERTTVFDRPAPELAKAEAEPEVSTPMGPMPTEWTWDLVHCRLLTVHAMASRLPRVLVPATYRSFLGNLQPQEPAVRHRPLTDADTKRFDWTMSRVDCWADIDRIVIKGVMSGHSLADVAAATQAWARRYGDKGLSKTSVHRRYRTNTTMMAAEWADLGEGIDHDTRECWLNLAARRS